jgi:hypothetical protein
MQPDHHCQSRSSVQALCCWCRGWTVQRRRKFHDHQYKAGSFNSEDNYQACFFNHAVLDDNYHDHENCDNHCTVNHHRDWQCSHEHRLRLLSTSMANSRTLQIPPLPLHRQVSKACIAFTNTFFTSRPLRLRFK